MLAASLLAWALAPGVTHAGPAADTGQILADFARQPGPQRITHLRRLWMRWETADPLGVEQALAGIGEDRKVEPAVRAYAQLLGAYARRRRGDLSGTKRQVEQLGFVTEWMVIGPFDNEHQAGFGPELGVERELAQPLLLDRAVQGKERVVRWRSSPPVHGYGWLDFGMLMPNDAEICACASTFVRDMAAAPGGRSLTLWVGATGAVKVYWNADLVVRDGAYRQLDADRIAAEVVMLPGFNRLTIKACGRDTAPTVAIRLAELDGAPATGLAVEASVAASTAAARTMRQSGIESPPAADGSAQGEGGGGGDDGATGASPGGDAALWIAPRAVPTRAEGPLQRFEAELAARPDDAATMEGYAHYLMVTGGDPAASHQARDLAARAAEQAPTVSRCLLAAKLAEDRNQRRRWVEAARAEVSSDAERVAVLLAEARLARSGAHWQDAIPLYDQVLRYDHQSIEAILGKVDLFVEAGLARTALATLDRAVREQPSSVALLRARAAQLRALGRDTEAAEVEARYAAYRFDDGGFLRQQIDRAIARRDVAQVEHWSSRLLASDPGSSWTHGVVARAQRAMGRADQAEATYRHALLIAPDDVGSLRSLADLVGERGRRAEQLSLLRRVHRLEPQDQAVRAYLEHVDPQSAREDERHGWPAERFLELRGRPAAGQDRRTLRKLTVLTLLSNGLARRFHQVAYQPLTDEAAATLRQYAFAYHADRQTVEIRSAKVYRADGSVDEAIEQGTASADDPALRMYTLQRVYYVQFPRLEVGDVVELRYRVDDVTGLGDPTDSFGELEYLQGAEQVVDAEVLVVAPKALNVRVTAAPADAIERRVRVEGAQRQIRMHAEDLPAIRSEPHMPPRSELAAHVHVSTAPSWDGLGRWYWGLVRDRLDVDDTVRQRAQELTRGLSADRDKVVAVYQFVANEIRYVALEFGIEGIRPRRAALTLARGWGDCKDKSALIISLLREVGIDAELVLVRSGLRGEITTPTASLAPFDHAIVWVPSLDLYLDGTAESTGSGELPAMIRGAAALRISPAGPKRVELPQPAAGQSVERRRFELRVAPSGRVDVHARLQSEGVTAPAWRRRYQAASTRRERVLRDLTDDLGAIELKPGAAGLRLLDLDDSERPVRLEAQGTRTARIEGGALRLSMGPAYRLTARYGSLQKRTSAVVLGPKRTAEEIWTLQLRPGQSVTAVPAPVDVESPFGRYERRVERSATAITVRSVLVLRQPRIAPSEYDAWRRFAREVDAASGPSLELSL
ncbi:MAG: DUF3857 domain-containing protein [Deltaproteobacteria bacterium]|nr:DUF3857 domain-containing protein [Deltaproteobacteria bacterium]MBW2536180.1 DUF3857 domain-containing protein [Deltaproteobacteria bacterium]